MDLEPEIAARAYQLWEQEGRPQGRDVEHWTEAERQLKEEGSHRSQREEEVRELEVAEQEVELHRQLLPVTPTRTAHKK